MKLTVHSHYPYPAESIVQVFGEQAFFTEKYQLCGAGNIRVMDFHPGPDQTRIRVQRDVKLAEALPAFARAILPDTVTVIQSDSWHRPSKTGQIEIELVSVPVRITADMALEDDQDGAAMTVEFDISVDLPLIGERIARLLARDLQKQYHMDTEAGQQVMARRVRRYL